MKKEIERRVAVLQSFSQGKKVQQRAVRGSGDWIDVESPSWNWDKNEYRVRAKDKLVSKYTIKKFSDYQMFAFRLNEFGRVIVSRNLYSMLMENEKIVCRVYAESMSFEDTTDMEMTKGARKFVNKTAISQEDKISLRVVNNFLKSISSGIRRPSDAAVARELSVGLSEMIGNA